MSRATERRLAKLEASAGLTGDFIPVFCRDDAEFEAAFAEKVRWGLCKGEDRARALSYYHEQFAEVRHQRNEALRRWVEGETSGYEGPHFGIHEEWVRVLK